MARLLKQTVLAGGVVYAAGTPEADVKADIPDKFWEGEAAESRPTGGENSYSTWKVDELRAEIAKRNEERDDDAKVPAEGNKAALVAALEADDQEA